MDRAPYDVLFLCTGNSARSIMAECALQHWGGDRFRAYSAGSHPTGEPHPLAIELLQRMQMRTTGLRSKSWDEFSGPAAPELDIVITVCDRARGESCPVWPGQPALAHWGCDDPAACDGDRARRERAFRRVYTEIESRIELLISLPIERLDRLALNARLEAIGKAPVPGPETPPGEASEGSSRA